MKLGMSYVLLELNIMAEAISGQWGGGIFMPPLSASLCVYTAEMNVL